MDFQKLAVKGIGMIFLLRYAIKAVKRRALLEAILLIVIGLTGICEAVRLIFYKDPYLLYDGLGPGHYVFVVSLLITTTGIIHLAVHLRKPQRTEERENAIAKDARTRLLCTIALFALYIILIDVIGYVVSTWIFFMVQFRIVGIKSLLLISLLSVGVTGALYSIFIKYCAVVFPRGFLF